MKHILLESVRDDMKYALINGRVARRTDWVRCKLLAQSVLTRRTKDARSCRRPIGYPTQNYSSSSCLDLVHYVHGASYVHQLENVLTVK